VFSDPLHIINGISLNHLNVVIISIIATDLLIKV